MPLRYARYLREFSTRCDSWLMPHQLCSSGDGSPRAVGVMMRTPNGGTRRKEHTVLGEFQVNGNNLIDGFNPIDPVGPIGPAGPNLGRPIDPEILRRVQIRPDFFEINRLWFKRPQTCRILMYRDTHQFIGPGFGLDHVIDALHADPWPWAKFEVTTAHRGSDATADLSNIALDAIDLDHYDELWLFGFNSSTSGTNALSQDEINAVEAFMNDGGGVLTTGDHDDLGRSLSGGLKRVGKMRGYGADNVGTGADRNTTLRAPFNQSDMIPQGIRVQYWYSFSGGGFPGGLQKFPHPVLCADQGALRRLPDHQHEGVVTIPSSFPVSEWPKLGSKQPRPEVIAWASVVQPGVDKTGEEFPVISAYDGQRANVGRIVADATWHHWFNVNLDGFNTNSQDYKDIISYFQNVAAWLAPKNKQHGMRNGVFWLALHEASLAEVSLKKLPLAAAVKGAKDALGRWAPQCMVHGWLLPFIPDRIQASIITTDPRGPKVRQAIEDIALVEAVATLQKEFSIQEGLMQPAASFAAVDKALQASVPEAIARVVKMCEADMKSVLSLADEIESLADVVDLRSANGSRSGGRARAGN